MRYLINIGVSPDRLEVEGYGEQNPLGDNSQPQGRAVNRRVQFKTKKIK
jgi:outer membrane protein OmpA-like peptidoglycan-associated protein